MTIPGEKNGKFNLILQKLCYKIYLVGLIVIFSLATWIRAALPPIPFLDNDFWGYLQPALSQLSTGSFTFTYRSFLYPTIVWGFLRIWPNFSVIVVAQHGLGLLAGILLIVAWERMRIFLPNTFWIQHAHRLAGWIMLAVYTFSNASISYEHSIRPEALFPLAVILCILIATEFSRRLFFQPSNRLASQILAGLLVILACIPYYLKPAWGIAAFTAMTPLAIAAITSPLRRLLPSIALGFLIVFAAFEIPERRYHQRNSGNDSFLPKILFCSHGEVIYEVLKKDASLPLSDPYKAVSNLLLPHFEQAKQLSSIPFGYSKLNPDDLLYRGAIGALEEVYPRDSRQIATLCYDYYRRAWQYNPLGMFRKIALQFFYFYCPWKSVVYSQATDFQVTRHLQHSLQMVQDRPSSWTPYQEYRNRVLSYLIHPLTVSLPNPLVALSTFLNPLYAPTVLLAAIAACWTLFSKNPLYPNLKISAFWCLYLLSFNFAMTFTIAAVHMMTVDRYHFTQTIFSILSQCFATIFLIYAVQSMLQKYRHHRDA